jgi:hypothetical protein
MPMQSCLVADAKRGRIARERTRLHLSEPSNRKGKQSVIADKILERNIITGTVRRPSARHSLCNRVTGEAVIKDRRHHEAQEDRQEQATDDRNR